MVLEGPFLGRWRGNIILHNTYDGDDGDDDDDDDVQTCVQHRIEWLLVWPKPCNEGLMGTHLTRPLISKQQT